MRSVESNVDNKGYEPTGSDLVQDAIGHEADLATGDF